MGQVVGCQAAVDLQQHRLHHPFHQQPNRAFRAQRFGAVKAGGRGLDGHPLNILAYAIIVQTLIA